MADEERKRKEGKGEEARVRKSSLRGPDLPHKGESAAFGMETGPCRERAENKKGKEGESPRGAHLKIKQISKYVLNNDSPHSLYLIGKNTRQDFQSMLQ